MSKKFTIIFLLIFLFSFWVFWQNSPRVANDYHLGSWSVISENSFPWIWRETAVADGLGEYTAATLWSQPIHVYFWILSYFQISIIWVTKVLLFLILIIGFFSLDKLLTYLKVDSIYKYTGILLYLSNSYFLLLIDGGQLSIALMYVIFPLCVYFYLKLVDKANWLGILKIIFSLSLISFFDIRFLFLLTLFFALHLVFRIIVYPLKENLKLFRKLVLIGLVCTLTLFLFHAYWLLPVILSKGVNLPQTYGKVDQVDFLSLSSITHSLLLQQPHWYQNIFGKISNFRLEFSIIPLLIFSLPFLKRKDKRIGFWLIVAVVGVFLSKGSQMPVGEIYNWLFVNLPGFSLFRDPVKFYLFIALSYSVLLPISLKQISQFNYPISVINKIRYFFPVAVFVYLIFLMWPVYFNQMTGMFSQPRFEKDFFALSTILNQDQNFSRIFWIPTESPLGFSSTNHPWVGASGLVNKRPFSVGIKGTYESFNFLREASYMGEIFDVAGIGYIVYPPLDPIRDDMHPDNIRYFYTFSNQLSKLPWLSKIDSSSIPLFKTKSHQDKFFITQNLWWVVGSDNIYTESTKSAELKLSKNTLIFAEEYPGLGERIDQLPQAKIVLNGKSLIDLAATFINNSSILFPARNLEFDPNESGWWKREASDLIKWREFLQTKYGIDNQDFDLGGGWAVAEGERSLKIDKKFNKGDMLLARVLESTRSGQLDFHNGEHLIGSINTKLKGNNIRWFEVGELKSGEGIEIQSLGDINVVNSLAILNKDEWMNFKDKASKLQEKVLDFNEINAINSTSPTVTYKRINPTKFVVNVANLTKPALLVFSQNYDNLWKLNGKSPLPVYSLLNGFEIDADGEYIVEFEAQKHVQPGLMISGLTTLILVMLLIRFNIRF